MGKLVYTKTLNHELKENTILLSGSLLIILSTLGLIKVLPLLKVDHSSGALIIGFALIAIGLSRKKKAQE